MRPLNRKRNSLNHSSQERSDFTRICTAAFPADLSSTPTRASLCLAQQKADAIPLKGIRMQSTRCASQHSGLSIVSAQEQ